jgi:hypothetical protein
MCVIEMNRKGRFLNGEVRVRVRGSERGGVRTLKLNSESQQTLTCVSIVM